MQKFAEMNQQDQVQCIQDLVPEFAAEYELDVKAIEHINLGFNATFKVTTNDNESYGFRININSKKSSSKIASEVQWLNRIADLDSLHAPIPLQTNSGEYCTSVWSDAVQKDLLCLAYQWIDGSIPGEDPQAEDYVNIGRNMAKLHRSTKDWIPSSGASMPYINHTLLSSTSNFPDERIPDRLMTMIDELMGECDKVHAQLSGETHLQPIHADLHAFNVVNQPNGIQAVIDFDDCGIGFPLQDFAISTFYLRGENDFEEHLIAGYSEILPIPGYRQQEYELLLIARQLVLLNDLLSVQTAEEREFVPQYLEFTEKRFQHFYDTGEFKLIRD